MRMEQIPLFQDEFMLINDAAAAIKALRLDDALDRCNITANSTVEVKT